MSSGLAAGFEEDMGYTQNDIHHSSRRDGSLFSDYEVVRRAEAEAMASDAERIRSRTMMERVAKIRSYLREGVISEDEANEMASMAGQPGWERLVYKCETRRRRGDSSGRSA
jgi:hypothetical protein